MQFPITLFDQVQAEKAQAHFGPYTSCMAIYNLLLGG